MKQVALVTGSSRGIGRAVAAQLAREGWAVCINYIQHQEAAESLLRQLRSEGHEAIAVQADVSDRAAVNAMVARAEAELGPIELLVNNAGVAGQCLFQDVTDEMWNRYMGVNPAIPFRLSCPICFTRSGAASSMFPPCGDCGAPAVR